MKPKVVRTVSALRRETASWRKEGLRYAVVPTMGAIHSGHTQLVTEGLKRADRVITTIFVNPKQFAANEDLDKYPRDEDGDVRKLGQAGSHMIYIPSPEEIYPEGFCTTVTLTGPAKAGLEDKFRPQFFDGVATIVAKLLIAARPDIALFGEKDFQQLAVIRTMVTDLGLPVDIIGVPTVRDADGLALSSRNALLTADQRRLAVSLPNALHEAARRIAAGEEVTRVVAAAKQQLVDGGFLRIDYFALVDAATLNPLDQPAGEMRLIAAATMGTTRLIDNIPIG